MSNSWDKWNNQQPQGRNAPISQVEAEERIVALPQLENETEAFEALSLITLKGPSTSVRTRYLRAEGRSRAWLTPVTVPLSSTWSRRSLRPS